ncbi:MAG: ATP phosphoribosyltransferase regulatory subunit [Desulfuromonas sp.]|nr:MAG: ATP phosphoribosyltransferase regulatory subunit [Desulfuromonas sp.]
MQFSDHALENALPKGVKDFLPIRAAKIGYLTSTLQEVFSRWGFERIIPASLEHLQVLERGLGSDLVNHTVRFDDRQSGRMVAFSPDMTPQIARIAATRMSELPLPLRLCYTGRVLRHAEQQAGKDREILQAGVELIGLESLEADAEMIAMVVECFRAVGAKEFSVDLGQVEFFRGVLDSLDLEGEAAHRVTEAISRKDASSLRELLAELDIDERARSEVMALPRLFGGVEVLERAAATVSNERSKRALETLFTVRDILKVYGVEEHVTFDLGELRGLDYHTGITLQGFLPGVGQAVCSGGRYDGLMASYGAPAPATGFTFNILELLFALDRELNGRVQRGCDVLLSQAGDDKGPAQRLAIHLRQRGYAVARDMIVRPREETLDYARKMHYRHVIWLEGGSVEVLGLADEQSRTLPFDELFNEKFTL